MSKPAMLSVMLFLWIVQHMNYFTVLSIQYLSTLETLLRFAEITKHKILPWMQRVLSFFLQKASQIFTYDEMFTKYNVNSYHIAVLPR